ncbi:MAG: iron-containing alcohol dehydrogenase [Syntrophales bacterium]
MKYSGVDFEPFFGWICRPRIMYSPGLRSEIGYEMSQLGGSRVLLLTDKGLMDAGVAQLVIDEIERSDLKLAGIFDEILQDARIDLINKGAALYREADADGMVVVGGGSVMDTAKAINIMIGSGEDDFQPLADQASLYEGAKQLPPHIAFPTTAGTGCEVTNGMVVLDMNAHAKLQVGHPFCNSDIAMLDPELTVKLPPKITAFTGMDALTHAIECITSTGAEPIADALSLHAIRLVAAYLPIAVKEPEKIEARGHMLIASNLAGQCLANTMTGAVHALAHALGARFGIPHGLANAIMLPWIMEFNLEEKPARFRMIADALGIETAGRNTLEAAHEAVAAVRDLQKTIGLTQTLKDFGVPADAETLQPLLELAAADAQMSYNPRYMEAEDILEIYLKAI